MASIRAVLTQTQLQELSEQDFQVSRIAKRAELLSEQSFGATA